MSVNVTQWPGEIGMFYICLSPSIKVSKASKNCTIFKFNFLHCLLMVLFLLSNSLNATYLNLSKIDISVINAYLANLMYVVILYCFLEQLWITRCRIGMSGDVEVNPGPTRYSCQGQSFLICHSNLNSLIIAQSFAKVSLLTTYLSVHKFDIVCLSETFFNPEIRTDNENLQIPGYSIARIDHLSNTKRGGVCVYYKTSLPLKVLDVKFFQECSNIELIIDENLCSFVFILYRSPSQSHDDFENFIKNFELNLDEINKKKKILS